MLTNQLKGTFSLHRIFLLMMIFLVSSSSTASFFSGKPYVGADIGLRRMAWKKDYGDNVYKRTAYQPNVYAGLKINRFFGFELGYEQIIAKKHTVVFDSRTVVLGGWVRPGVSVRSNVKLRGWHVDLIGLYPLKWSEHIELLGGVGLASLTTKQQCTFISDLGAMLDIYSRTFRKSKVVPRVAAGFQYKMTDRFSLRAILWGIENTSLLGDLGPPLEDPTRIARTKMRHSTYHSLGFVFSF